MSSLRADRQALRKVASHDFEAVVHQRDAARSELKRLRQALERIATAEPSCGPDYTPNILARKALDA